MGRDEIARDELESHAEDLVDKTNRIDSAIDNLEDALESGDSWYSDKEIRSVLNELEDVKTHLIGEILQLEYGAKVTSSNSDADTEPVDRLFGSYRQSDNNDEKSS